MMLAVRLLRVILVSPLASSGTAQDHELNTPVEVYEYEEYTGIPDKHGNMISCGQQ